MKQQVESIRHFLRLTQFIFVVFVILFLAVRFGLPDMVEFLRFSIITDNLPYLGGAAVLAYIVFFLILLSQKQQVKALQEKMRREEFRKGGR